MVASVFAFAALSALFELFLLLKLAPQKLLSRTWFQVLIHVVVIAGNLAIHFGTIVGTMTAITAGLVSFMTIPFAAWIKTFWKYYRSPTSS